MILFWPYIFLIVLYTLMFKLCHLQELNLTEAAVNKLHTVVLRFCGDADQALPRLRGALPSGMFPFANYEPVWL